MAEYPDEFVPTLKPDLLQRRHGQEEIVWSPQRAVPVVLDAVAAVMLDVFDGDATLEQLREEIAQEIGIEQDAAHEQLQRIITLFDRGGLLASSEPDNTADEFISNRRLFVNPVSH